MTAHRRKPCRTCGRVLTLRHFYADRNRLLNDCKRCKIAAVGANRELKEDQYRAMRREISARPYYRQQRAAYARSERGRVAHRVACRRYYRMRRLFEARA